MQCEHGHSVTDTREESQPAGLDSNLRRCVRLPEGKALPHTAAAPEGADDFVQIFDFSFVANVPDRRAIFEKFKGLRTHAGESHRPTGFRKDERLFCFRNLEPLESHLPDMRLHFLQIINFR